MRLCLHMEEKGSTEPYRSPFIPPDGYSTDVNSTAGGRAPHFSDSILNQSRIHKSNFKAEYLFYIKYRCRTHNFRLTASSQFGLICFESDILCTRQALLFPNKSILTQELTWSSSSRVIPCAAKALFLTDWSLLLCLSSLKAVKSCWYWRAALLHLVD